MIGTEYVIEQLGAALKASHEALAQRQQQIAALEAKVDDLVHLAAEPLLALHPPERPTGAP